MSWQKFSNVTPSLMKVFVIFMRETPYYAKRFLHEGKDLVAFNLAYSSIKPDDPELLMRYNTPLPSQELKDNDKDFLWKYFNTPE